MKLVNKYMKGAASFYIVAFSTLILMIVAISFATVIISEVERTSNDDLSQSAYDSALAGIEDAKLAYYNYQNCLKKGNVQAEEPNDDLNVTCNEILYYMDIANSDLGAEDCEIVWKILGKSDVNGNKIKGEIVESTSDVSGNNMYQATTCVTMTDVSDGYRGTLTSSNIMDVIKLKFANGVDVDNISSMRLRWFSRDDAVKTMGDNSNAKFVYKTGFPTLSVPVTAPPVVSLTILQTGPVFNIDSFNKIVSNEQTDRGTLYFTPVVGDPSNNYISKSALVKSNDKTVKNNPYNVECTEYVNRIDGYACSVIVELPKPVDGERNKDTFEAIVSMPYGQPSTEFLLEFYCSDGALCGTESIGSSSGAPVAKMKGVQLEVDSTGRANDLYRRVVATLKSKNDLTLSVMGPLELLDSGEDTGLTKNLTVTKEYNFKP